MRPRLISNYLFKSRFSGDRRARIDTYAENGSAFNYALPIRFKLLLWEKGNVDKGQKVFYVPTAADSFCSNAPFPIVIESEADAQAHHYMMR